VGVLQVKMIKKTLYKSVSSAINISKPDKIKRFKKNWAKSVIKI